MRNITPDTGDTSETAGRVGAGWRGETRQNQLYKPFVRGAILIVLTIGCTLGALNLAVMGFGADLSAVWTPLIQSHGYAQVFGWVGLFIMGIAYHMVPRFYLRPLQRPQLVLPSFVLTVAGIVLRFMAQPFASDYTGASWLLVGSALLALAGMTLFVWAMYDTVRHGSDRFGTPASKLYIGAGFAWLWAGQAATVGLMTYLAVEGQNVIPGNLDAPYLRALLSGAIVTTVLGFTLRTVPHLLGLHAVTGRSLYAIFVVYTAAVLVQVGVDLGLPGGAGQRSALPGVLAAGCELLALALFAIVSGVLNLSALRTAQPAKKNPWPERFVRTAYGWLLLASGLNLGFSLSAFAGTPVPHPFVASYHHALTVGFISMMILGMSMRLVPVFIGAMNKRPRLSALIFVLVNLGSGMRVVSESMAFVYGGAFYVIMGMSGLIEVCGLLVYGVALWQALDQPSYGQVAAGNRGAGLVLGARVGQEPAMSHESRRRHG
jgi:hypothetical protein